MSDDDNMQLSVTTNIIRVGHQYGGPWIAVVQPNPDSHSLRFFLHKEGAWAVADRSGDTPEHTEDGILWLDHFRDLRAGPAAHAVPVVCDRTGRSSWVPCSARDAMFAASVLRKPIVLQLG